MCYKLIILALAVSFLICDTVVYADDPSGKSSSSGPACCEEHKFKKELDGSSSEKFKAFQSDQVMSPEEARQKDMQARLSEMRNETWDDRYRY